jgi:hypothetical protein
MGGGREGRNEWDRVVMISIAYEYLEVKGGMRRMIFHVYRFIALYRGFAGMNIKSLLSAQVADTMLRAPCCSATIRCVVILSAPQVPRRW